MTVTDNIHANIDRSVYQGTPDSVFLHGDPALENIAGEWKKETSSEHTTFRC